MNLSLRIKKLLTPASKPGFWVGVVFLVFAAVFCSISLVNHYQFRTYAADLGIFNHALHSFSHGHADYITLHLSGQDPSFLGDHFSPLVLLFTPFYWIFGSYTLLILQILSILAGGWAVYLFAGKYTGKKWLPLLILLHFFSLWTLYSALAFDYHTNVTGAMLVPWLILAYYNEQKKRFLLFLVLILMAKETMPLWVAFIMIGLMLMKRKTWRQYLRFEIPILVFCLLYFWFVVEDVMPWFQEGKGTRQLALYANLGGNLPEILKNIITHPGLLIDALFRNTLADPMFDGIKQEFHFMVLVSGGLALLVRPAWLVMLIPVYAQKFLGNNYALWGINYHYCIEFAPILSLALFDAVNRIPKTRIVYGITALFILSSGWFTYQTMEERKSLWYNQPNHRFYHREHYHTGLDIQAVNSILRNIPADIPLSASSELAPHLCNRDKLYFFPVVKDADRIVLLADEKISYPLNPTQKTEFIRQLLESGEFVKSLDRDGVLILKRP